MDMLLPLAVDLLQGTVGYQPLNKFLLPSLYGMETYGESESSVLDFGREQRNVWCR